MALRLTVAAAAALFVPVLAFAQADEIQVYDGGLAGKGVFNLTLHNNFSPIGLKDRAFPGAIIPNHSLNGVFEWAYGVNDWFEAGLYLPLYSVAEGRGPAIDGGKVRLLFAVPHADDRTFFYGANFEFSYNSKHWDERRITSEIRPIVGWHLHPWDIIFNPILDTSYAGGPKSLDFAPASRVAYNLNPKWAVAVEEYADTGPLRHFLPGAAQTHQIYGVVDHSGKSLDIEAGIGFGVTGTSDKLTLKLILARDLHSRGKH